MQELFFDQAPFPNGWARNACVCVEGGTIREVTVGGPPGGGERVPWIALPGLPNLHRHAFQRGMAGVSERRRPAADSFWSRVDSYIFVAGARAPEDGKKTFLNDPERFGRLPRHPPRIGRDTALERCRKAMMRLVSE
jgi:cytosine/adenosine deaminase-related metal-dependent hydrolase